MEVHFACVHNDETHNPKGTSFFGSGTISTAESKKGSSSMR